MSARTNGYPTVVDVARIAGVSIGTVSNVLNNPQIVTPRTRAKVLAAIEQSGFIRNSNARSLTVGAVPSIALIVPDLTNTLFVEISKGAQAAAHEAGLSLMIADADNDVTRQDQYLDLFIEARATGILLAPMLGPWAGYRRVRGRGHPVVLINYDDPDLDACTVLMDNEEGGFLAAEHLIHSGRKRLLFVGADDMLQPVRERRRGIRAAAARHRIDLEETDVAELGCPGEAYQLGSNIAAHWSKRGGPLGILAVTDLLANEILTAIANHGRIRVPRDISVMGMDGNRMAWDAPSPMTTLSVPGEAMGAEAVRLLLAENASDHVHERAVYPMRLHPRRTTVVRKS